MESELCHLSGLHREQGTGTWTRVPIVALVEPGGEGRPAPKRLTGGRVYCADTNPRRKGYQGTESYQGPSRARHGETSHEHKQSDLLPKHWPALFPRMMGSKLPQARRGLNQPGLHAGGVPGRKGGLRGEPAKGPTRPMGESETNSKSV